VRVVKSSLVFKLFIVVFLVATLGWKLAVRGVGSAERSNRDEQAAVADFLTRHLFTVSLMERPAEGRPWLVANAGVCRLTVIKSQPMGSDRDLIRHQAAVSDQLFFVFRGKVYSDQPTWLTVTDFLWARIMRELGIDSQPSPIMAVIAPAGCRSDKLPWEELARTKVG
jgi:hypothetical protein